MRPTTGSLRSFACVQALAHERPHLGSPRRLVHVHPETTGSTRVESGGHTGGCRRRSRRTSQHGLAVLSRPQLIGEPTRSVVTPPSTSSATSPTARPGSWPVGASAPSAYWCRTSPTRSSPTWSARYSRVAGAADSPCCWPTPISAPWTSSRKVARWPAASTASSCAAPSPRPRGGCRWQAPRHSSSSIAGPEASRQWRSTSRPSWSSASLAARRWTSLHRGGPRPAHLLVVAERDRAIRIARSCTRSGAPRLRGRRPLASELIASKVTGVLAFNDLQALGIIAGYRTAGRSVPQDVSVVGSDDIAAAAMSDPPLTTVAAPVHQLGEAAFQLVAQLLAGRHPTTRCRGTCSSARHPGSTGPVTLTAARLRQPLTAVQSATT